MFFCKVLEVVADAGKMLLSWIRCWLGRLIPYISLIQLTWYFKLITSNIIQKILNFQSVKFSKKSFLLNLIEEKSHKKLQEVQLS